MKTNRESPWLKWDVVGNRLCGLQASFKVRRWKLWSCPQWKPKTDISLTSRAVLNRVWKIRIWLETLRINTLHKVLTENRDVLVTVLENT